MRETRQGKHREGNTLFGAYITPEIKALAMLIREVSGISFTQMILDGIDNAAIKAGIKINGQIVPEHQKAYKILVEMSHDTTTKKKKGPKK